MTGFSFTLESVLKRS